MSSVILSVACVILTLAVNFSADKAITNALPLTPPIMGDEVPIQQLQPAKIIPAQQYELFKAESIIAMVLVVFTGSVCTYFLAGQTLKPLKKLTNEIKHKTINNLDESITLPIIKDEIFEISTAFNEMSHNLKKSFQLQEQFSADAAHELRTPLSVMIAKLEVFKLSNQPPQGETLTMINEVCSQLDRLSNLTNDLLWFSKDLPLKNNINIELHLLLSDLAYELAEKSDEKKIEIIIEGDELNTIGDDALLERVFYNLLENAIKYSSKHSSVTVTLAKKNNLSVVTIKDVGEGISDTEKNLIFEPFYRIDKSRSRFIGGNGLGLAICKKILDKHLATIQVYDNHPSGSIFEITFSS